MSDKERPTISVSEAAWALGISRATAYQYFYQGKLPGALRIGSRLRVSRAVFNNFLEGKENGSSSQHPVRS